MKRIDGIIGNVNDDPALASAVADHEQADTLETVVLDDTERRRSRIRVTTDAGTDLGILVDQPELTAGDILLLNTSRAVIVAFKPRDAFVIDFSSSQVAVSTALKLGHRIGNQHWNIAIDNKTIYIPVEADHAIIEEVLGSYIPDEATTYYETVDAKRFLEDDNNISANAHNSAGNHEQTDHNMTVDKYGHDHEHNHDHDNKHNQTDCTNTNIDHNHTHTHAQDSSSDPDSTSADSLGDDT